MPGDPVADAAFTVPDHGAPEGPGSAGNPLPAVPSRRARTSDRELHNLLAKMRGRCMVMESTPQSTVADVQWNEQAPETVDPDTIVVESEPAASVADACCWDADKEGSTPLSVAAGSVVAVRTEIENRGPAMPLLPQLPAALERTAASSTDAFPARKTASNSSAAAEGGEQEPSPGDAVEAAPGALDTGEGPLLLPSARRLVWGQRFQLDPGLQDGAARGEAGASASVAACLTAGRPGEAPTVEERRLADGFVEKHLHWLDAPASARGDAASGLAPAFEMLAQLLRYHSPIGAWAVESFAPDLGLNEVLSACCGGHVGLLRLLLGEPSDADAAVHLLDTTVLGGHETLLLFLAAALLIKFPWPRAGKPEECTVLLRKEFDAQLRAPALDGGQRQAAAGCIEQARDLHEATPQSLHSKLACLGRGDCTAGKPGTPAVCYTSPEEVLRHVYERPMGSWRLVVVDIRREPSTSALPLCMRLGANQDRREFLRGLPYGAGIHLCLLGDRAPVPGEEAFELCRFMTSEPVFRSHVSVAEGGWPIMEQLVRSAGLELVQAEAEAGQAEEEGAAAAEAGASQELPAAQDTPAVHGAQEVPAAKKGGADADVQETLAAHAVNDVHEEEPEGSADTGACPELPGEQAAPVVQEEVRGAQREGDIPGVGAAGETPGVQAAQEVHEAEPEEPTREAETGASPDLPDVHEGRQKEDIPEADARADQGQTDVKETRDVRAVHEAQQEEPTPKAGTGERCEQAEVQDTPGEQRVQEAEQDDGTEATRTLLDAQCSPREAAALAELHQELVREPQPEPDVSGDYAWSSDADGKRGLLRLKSDGQWWHAVHRTSTERGRVVDPSASRAAPSEQNVDIYRAYKNFEYDLDDGRQSNMLQQLAGEYQDVTVWETAESLGSYSLLRTDGGWALMLLCQCCGWRASCPTAPLELRPSEDGRSEVDAMIDSEQLVLCYAVSEDTKSLQLLLNLEVNTPESAPAAAGDGGAQQDAAAGAEGEQPEQAAKEKRGPCTPASKHALLRAVQAAFQNLGFARCYTRQAEEPSDEEDAQADAATWPPAGAAASSDPSGFQAAGSTGSG